MNSFADKINDLLITKSGKCDPSPQITHEERLDIIITSDTVLCCTCGKTFKNIINARVHIKKFHSNKKF